MNDWTAGYVADIDYTYGYYLELNPHRVKLAFLNAGLVTPEFGTACELGFGQGVSTNLHAAASICSWFGTDFNPSQAGFAQELANISQNEAKLFDQAFHEFAEREDLPDFDYIGLHGIWSWISDENRAVIVDFIRRKLKVGGVLYISYNTQPGLAAMIPMRDLLTEHSEVMGAAGHGIVPRIESALEFAEKLIATNPIFARANPVISEKIKAIKGQNKNYVAHEYFNKDWKPMSFADVGRWLAPAKVEFACSANYLDFVDAINLTTEQQDLLKEIPDNMFRQTVRDFMVNQQFRKDYWVKGKRRLNPLQKGEGLSAQKVILTVPRNEVSLKVRAGLGEAKMNEEIYLPILDLLADFKPKTLGQLESALKEQKITFVQVAQAVMMLAGAGQISAVQDDAYITASKKRTNKINQTLISRARGGNDVSYLASPVTGGGFGVNRFQQLFLLAIAEGKKNPNEWAELAWMYLSIQGQKIVKDGEALESAEKNIAELTIQANEFASKQLPILKALQIV